MRFVSNSMVEELLQPEDIHESHRQTVDGVFAFFVVAVVMTVGHILNLYLSVFQNDSLGMFVLLHLVLTGAAYAYARAMHSAGKDPRFAYLLCVMGFVIGPLGTFGSLVSCLLVVFFARVSTSFNEWFVSIFPQRDLARAEKMYEDIVLGRDENGKEYSVLPFMDVLSAGSDAQKRVVISRMTSNFRPAFAAAFRKALRDPSTTVRVHAATAITKIENAFYERLVKLQTLADLYPKKPEVKKALAQHYDDYAFTGVLDSFREQQNRERARAVYLEYLALAPADIEARQHIGRLLVRSGKAQEAADWFKSCMDEGYMTDAMKLWYFECLFDAGQYTRLRDAVFSLPVDAVALRGAKPELADALELWAGRVAPSPTETPKVA